MESMYDSTKGTCYAMGLLELERTFNFKRWKLSYLFSHSDKVWIIIWLIQWCHRIFVSDLNLERFRVYRNVTLGFIKGLQITFRFHNRWKYSMLWFHIDHLRILSQTTLKNQHPSDRTKFIFMKSRKHLTLRKWLKPYPFHPFYWSPRAPPSRGITE